MSASRIVRPEVVTVPISNGDWLVLKKRLNAGEQRAYFARLYIASADGSFRVNPLLSGVSLMLAYLVDWSLVNTDGTPLQIRDASLDTVTALLDSIDPDSFAEIRLAVEQHANAMQAARELEKNSRDGESNEPAISPSRGVAAGASSGSVN